MASMSGGMEKQGIRFSSMKQPPLLKLLKTILSEYPDGGQILKELIQNAEDAGAYDVKILYDGRRINNDRGETAPKYNKFFKGPALCVYNNAEFSEDDWEGITMIYNSKKEHNPLKVGRFGLGFKSVFHMTDYPCLVSCNKLLMIDPQQPTEKVNALVDLNMVGKLEEEGLSSEAFWTAFDGAFGLSKEHVNNGYFPGTLFWFPLREEASSLSETLYDESKVMNLFKGFQQEASSILLFLKSLETISMLIRGADNRLHEYSKVALQDSDGIVRQSRYELTEGIKLLTNSSEREDLGNEIKMNIEVTAPGFSKTYEWLVVNYFVGKTAGPDFMALINDKNLAYCPYVGVAAPLNALSGAHEGHVFCFLPLPREGSSSTGLPIHVNGFFALSQNRHHLKWETEEQEGNKIDDKPILWNKCLLREALPRAYAQLIKSLTERSNNLGNTIESIANVYSCLPVSGNTQNRWSMLEAALYSYVNLKTIRFLFTLHNRSWILLPEALFATFTDLPKSHVLAQDAVIRCLYKIGKCYVKVNADLFITIQKYAPHTKDLSPEMLALCLHGNEGYRSIAHSDKLDVLAYLLSDGENCEKVNQLELLPLASGEWTSFRKNGEPIFSCTENLMKILPGLEGRLLMRTSEPLLSSLNRICSLGMYQIKEMSVTDLKELLQLTMKNHFGSSSLHRMTLSTSLTAKWLYDVWQIILSLKETEIHDFANLQIVPVLQQGTWLKPETVDLVKLSDLLLVKSSNGDDLPDGVCTCFKVMGVTVLQSLPDWIPVGKVNPYFFWPTQRSIIDLLSKISDTEDSSQAIQAFNASKDSNVTQDVLSFLAKCQHQMSLEARNLVKQLHLFRTVEFINQLGINGSVSDYPEYIFGTEGFPKNVPLPFRCLEVETEYESLLKCLGARKVSLEELVTCVLRRFVNEENGDEDVQEFMEYFVKNFHLFRSNPAIVDIARNVHFIRTREDSTVYKASELYDPSNTKLQDLLYDETLLPENSQLLNDEFIATLKCIGLNGYSDINVDIILQVAKTLDTCAGRKSKHITYTKKAIAFMELLSSRPDFLDDTCYSGDKLKECLASLSCIFVQKEIIAPYPRCLRWYEHETELCRPTEARDPDMCLLVGATMPIVANSSDRLTEKFEWKQPPPLLKVIEQLHVVRNCFTVRCRSEIMPSIKAIFDHLNIHQEEASDFKAVFISENLLWTGEEFVSADKVIITSNTDDIDLRPYFYSVSSEYNDFQNVFTKIGCRLEQDAILLQEALRRIKAEHYQPQPEQVVERDKRMVCAILTKLAKAIMEKKLIVNEQELLIMIDDQSENTLTLKPVSQCTYEDDPACFSELEDNVFLVHKMIPSSIAEELGVKSITQKAVLDAEELGVQEWGQKEKLTTRIHTLLRDAYTDGLSVPKELIQNADDAGATEVKFLYDERLNKESRERVLSKGMRGFQGPALWVYNDQMFTDNDLQNITKLNAGTKQTDSKKIGKFGLGFCSVYNLTDMPSFVTGSNIVFFDPHEKNLGSVVRNKGTGLRYKLPNRTLVSRHKDQFKPYSDIFGCNIIDCPRTGYKGTLFRLPLRTTEQAKESEIYKVSYTRDEMIPLLQMMIRAAGNMLLFTQNVQKIEIHHLPENANDATESELLFSLNKECIRLPTNRKIPCESILPRLPDLLQRKCSFQEIHRCNFEVNVVEKCKTITDISDLPAHSKLSWIVSWATGNKLSLEMYNILSAKNALPISAVAVPCSTEDEIASCSLDSVSNFFYSKGHLYCFLPLPLPTGLPVHINGCFSVTSDRRQLVSITEDDKDKSSNDWNIALMEDAVVNAQILLLETLSSANVDRSYKYYDLWPISCDPTALPFKQAFYKHIIATNAKVFFGGGSWVPFQNVMFLDPGIRQQPLGDIMFNVVSHFEVRTDKTLIEMPEIVLENMRKGNEDREEYIQSATIYEQEICLLILRNLKDKFWSDKLESRNALLHYALCQYDSVVNAEMKNISCIPTEPSNELCKPSELIHPESILASLFNKNDGRFPLATKEFRDNKILAGLVEIGMLNKLLPHELLLDRCHSIPKLAESCGNCAFDRCRALMKYMSDKTVYSQLEQDMNTLNEISEIHMFPILQKPSKWAFSWKADSIPINQQCSKNHYRQTQCVFGKSKYMFQQSICDLVGIVECVADESVFEDKFEKTSQRIMTDLKIQGKKDVQQETLVSQMKHIAFEYTDTSKQIEELKRLHRSLFRHFEYILNVGKEKGHELNVLKTLCEIPVVLVGYDLVKTSNVAFEMKQEYPPILYKVSTYDRPLYHGIYTFLGVKEYFSIDDLLEAFSCLKNSWGLNSEADVENANGLLRNLQFIMSMSNLEYESIPETHNRIYAPDISGELWPTKELVIENEEFETNSSMNILHHGIVPSVAQFLGVKTKEIKCFEDISEGISFGQREKLETRIKGLLNAYPCDSSIMNELLQNADDAGASEINFVKDYRTHPTKRLFSESCKPLQGPSLCVYNNSYFTKKDLEGLHNLGKGSKHEDPTKTGQYGVGFNAVYHLTDTPSFLTVGPEDSNGGLLIYLDPLCKHVPKATSSAPGQKCSYDGVKRNFPDQLRGFSSDKLIQGEKGTVFRFPLRTTQSEISNEEVDTDRMDEILTSFRKDMYDSILFLKNINCIKISNITTGSLIEEYSVHVKLDENAIEKRIEFNNKVHRIVKENRNHKELNLEIQPFHTVYEIEVYDCLNISKRWAVVQNFGFSKSAEHLEIIKEKIKDGNIGQLPLGGIAMPLNELNEDQTEERQNTSSVTNENLITARAFCFLPLPLRTGFPLHVNGHFALDHEARRNIGKEGYKGKWNYCLANEVIIPAWIIGLLHLQTNIQEQLHGANNWHDVHQIFAHYHKMFPLQDKTYDEFWNDLINSFYKIVLIQTSTVFPCILDTESCFIPPNEYLNESQARFHVLWTLVATASSHGLDFGVFNDIENYESSTPFRSSAHLTETMLKSFGLKLLCTPRQIWRTIKKFGFSNIPVSTPDFVIEYLKKHMCSNERRTIGPVNADISETKFITSFNLRSLVAFLHRDRYFFEKIHGLPILLTADSTLRVCSLDYPVYVSEFARLLPRSANIFIHEDLRTLFEDEKAFKSRCFKGLQVNDFIRLLPENMNPLQFAARKEVYLVANVCNDVNYISGQWLCMFYDFLVSNSTTKIIDNTTLGPASVAVDMNKLIYLDREKFHANISLFKEWSFLPCMKQNTEPETETETKAMLQAFSEATHVLHLSENDLQEDSLKSFKKIALPELGLSAFRQCKYATSIIAEMKHIVASPERPSLLLECLVFHKTSIQTCDLTPQDALNILSFLARNMSALKANEDDQQLRSKIKMLPLFLTQQMVLTDIVNQTEVIVLPKEIPFLGIQEWAESCNITLLKKNDSVQSLYDFLEFTDSDINTVYADKILPEFSSVPVQYWMAHIDFLRKRLMNKRSLTVSEQRIIHRLTKFSFISVKGEKKRANELYSQNNAVFACMLNENCFPPKYMQRKDWFDFLKRLGLICRVDDTMLLRFASEIEHLGINRMNEDLRYKSSKLLECFQINNGMDWEPQTLKRLKSVRFLLPYCVSDEKNSICLQFDGQRNLKCFENSISQKHEMLCWTSMSLLEDEICERLDKNVRKALRIWENSPVDRVILHCQNVCDSFKGLLKVNCVDKKFVKKQMKQLYEYFDKTGYIDDKMKKRLMHKPIIYLPDDSEIVTVNEAVIGLQESDEIKPYLYAAPTFYGEFFTLFQNLGCRKNVDFCHYAKVLEILREESMGKEMTITELWPARKAIQHLFSSKSIMNRRASECKALYLPDRKMVLTNVKDLVVSDRISYEIRLQGKVDISLFAGFDLLEVPVSDPVGAICSLPDHLKPLLLSQAVTESICWDRVRELENSIKARKLEAFLHSEYFANGLCRIIKEQSRKSNEKIKDTCFEELKQCVGNITVRQVTDLKTILYYKSVLIPDTERDSFFYTKREEEVPFAKQIFYFKDNSDLERVNINKLLSGLTKLVLSCSDRLNESSAFYITPVLQAIENPEMIQNALDDLCVGQFDVPQIQTHEHFPMPGTAVDPKFFPFLEQGIFPFKKYEYVSVAMDLDDRVFDADSDNFQDPVYIYVHIIRNASNPNCSNLSHRYVVNTGNPGIESEIVPIYRLFRFVRRKEEPGCAMQLYGDEHVLALPFDENCKRIRDEISEAWNLSEEDRKRVIRRLYLKWYPDRNPENRDYCAQIFMYFKVILSRLENKEELGTDARAEVARGPSNFSSSSFYYANLHQRAETFVQAYKDNIEEYNHSYRRRQGLFSHRQQVKVKRPDVTEANRWLRQAKCDFLAAKAFVSVAADVDGFNWICYTCHQACEKALKAAYYARDADNVPRGSQSHSLTDIASDADMREQARLLEDRLGDHTKLRYPDALSRPKTPSDMFKKEDAEFAINIAEKMINLVEEFIS